MVGIHVRERSFSEKWIKYCTNQEINFQIINLFDTDILNQIRSHNITHILFHFNTKEYKNNLFIKDLVFLLELEGIKVFPEHSAFWHYDDKLKQKYLFEQLNLPHAPMHVFYTLSDTLNWINEATYPFVFKLKGGAGSRNVKLVSNRREAKKLAKKMFGNGFKPIPSILKDPVPLVRKHKKKRDWKGLIRRAPGTIRNLLKVNDYFPREKGYFLAQDFYANNNYDTRVAVIGDKACAFRRKVRDNDFRASGSGLVEYGDIDLEMVEIAFDAARKIGGTSLAFDFIYNDQKEPVILEASYCYLSEAVTQAGGYWDSKLEYHNEKIVPEQEIINNLIATAGAE